MVIASIALMLLLIPITTFILIFPIYKISFAQENVTQGTDANQSSVSFNTIIAGIVSGGAIGAGATLIGTYINSRSNMKIKNQELEHALALGLLKHRIECYALVIKCTEPVTSYQVTKPNSGVLNELKKQLEHWFYDERGILLMSEISKKKYHTFLNTLENEKFLAKDVHEPKDLQEIMDVRANFNESLLRDIGGTRRDN